jgi:signal transduction histidine kinase
MNQHLTDSNVVLVHDSETFYGFNPRADHGYYYVDLLVPSGSSRIYVRNKSVLIRVMPRVDLVPATSTPNDALEKFMSARYTIIILTAFLAVVLFQAVYILLQYSIVRSLDYLNYFYFLLCLLVYFFCRLDYWYNTGLLMDVLPVVAPYLNDAFLALPVFFYLRFSRHFIGTERRFPKINHTMKRAEWIILVITVVSVVFICNYKSAWSIWLMRGFTIVFLFFSLYLIRFFYLQKDLLVNFVLLGSFFALTGNFVAMLLPLMDMHIGIDNSLFTIAGISCEILLFNTGLGYKAKNEQLEKIKAQNAVISELDRNRLYHQEMEDMRGRIADDLHDDVGSTLSSISVYAELGLRGDDTKRESMLVKIADSAQRMMSAMNDIVWAIHSKNDSLGDLTDKMRQFATERLVGENVTFELENEKIIDDLQLTMRARRNILLMFKEAVHNAMKHGKAHSISCKVKSITNGLSIVIEDDGVGFDADRVKLGNGITSMRKRAQELGGSLEVESITGNGTRIGFYIPLNKLTIET